MYGGMYGESGQKVQQNSQDWQLLPRRQYETKHKMKTYIDTGHKI